MQFIFNLIKFLYSGGASLIQAYFLLFQEQRGRFLISKGNLVGMATLAHDSQHYFGYVNLLDHVSFITGVLTRNLGSPS